MNPVQTLLLLTVAAILVSLYSFVRTIQEVYANHPKAERWKEVLWSAVTQLSIVAWVPSAMLLLFGS